ncbi:MAG: hypothetical protein E7576_13960 [Ruminococcaceae bacterium]|nr:hypothetical protein [Oscillospiraceae bacterium]
MKKRTLCLMLAALLLLLASCSESKTNAEEETTPSAVSGGIPVEQTEETEETTDGREMYAPELPERNYDGYTFRIMSRDDSMHSYPVHTRDLIAEEQTGEALHDAVFARNAKIEDQLGIKITIFTENETVSETTPNNLVEASVMADSDEYDMLATHMIYGANSAVKHVFLNFRDLEYTDYSKPYWNPSAQKAFSVGDNNYLALSDFCFSSADNTHCMVFNKKLAEDFGVGDLYGMIREGTWTNDAFSTLAESVAVDANGDGKMGEDDVFGYFIGGTSGLINFLFAADLHVTAKDEDNIPYLDLMSERTVSVFEWAYKLAHSDCSYTVSSWVSQDVPRIFGADHALFMTTQVGVIEDLREMEADFGVLPYPKWDEQQQNYGHYVDGHATLMAIPKTCRDLEREGIFLEAISYESYLSCLPVYYDVLMTKKNVRDEQSGEMLELVYNSRVFDFAYVYDNFGMSFCFSNLITSNNEDIASYYKKNEKVANKMLEKNIKAYGEG